MSTINDSVENDPDRYFTLDLRSREDQEIENTVINYMSVRVRILDNDGEFFLFACFEQCLCMLSQISYTAEPHKMGPALGELYPSV